MLTDILGDEDAMGDMDFKVAGTAHGVTGIQMDIKITGIPQAVMRQALGQAKQARLHILDRMASVLAVTESALPGHAALMTALRIGVLEARAHGTVRRVAIFGGFAEIGNDSVTVLADGATLAEDVDVPSARAEKAAAELALATATAEELPAVRARIDAATARLEAARP